MEDREQYVRYQQDQAVLAAIGAYLDPQISRIQVRLPRSVAESAVAAWGRDELGEIGEESREEYELRDDAAELALIGLAITSRGVWDSEEVVVDLDVAQISAALRTAR
ncbi:hypothetical protein [Streptosporangium amethystogenes]|uniref:hypothetical protein n=1 Tax=Streptosporangium amethystogenes TaxID=2002 RepID=UPI0004CBD592|nr:hypothetical protein [Streptosporangium amethystogenes]